jgi:beta-galactosidase
VDIISEKDDLTGYSVVIVPSMYLLSDETATNLAVFARSGGIVVFTPRTGVKDETNSVVNMMLPGLVSEMCGIEIEEYKSMPLKDQETIHFGLPGYEGTFNVSIWAEVLKTLGAEVVARYQRDEYAGKAAISRNRFGDGQVIYLGIFSSDERFYDRLAHWILSEARIKASLETGSGVEVVERWQGGKRLLFLLNHSNQPQFISLPGELIDLISGNLVSRNVQLDSKDVMILAEPSKP